MPSLLSRREAVLWAAGFLVISALLVGLRFESEDPDSALYAALSARLAAGPVTHWIAPEWWGYWNSEGLFREHPVGVLLLPTALGALGLPGVQAAYIVGMAAGLAAILLIARLVARITTVRDARAVLVLLQLLPLAFIFRIRANHEYPMLVCLLVAIVGIDAVRRSWRWLWVTPLALCAAVLVKSMFVVIPLLAVVWWLVTNPLGERGPVGRAVAAIAVGLVAIGVMCAAYEAMYVRIAGESFWAGMWARQMAPLSLGGTMDEASTPTVLHHLGFYALRGLWHPAPWSLALIAAAWSSRHRWRGPWQGLPEPSRRGIVFGLGFAATTITMFLPSSRFAERYIFSANYAIAAVGIVVALHQWPRLRAALDRLDERVPALPVVCWTILMLLRLVVGPLLPRIAA